LVADLGRELELGARVRLGRVLVVGGRLGDRRLVLLAQARTLEREVNDALLVGAEDDLALQHARRVVQVHDGLLGAADRLVRAGACVRTWIVPSSGIRASSVSRRTKSKSVWLADGKPTSISL